MAKYDINYTLSQAIGLFNQDQVRIATMYNIELNSGIDKIDTTLSRMQVYGNSFTLPDRTVNFDNLQYRAYNIPIPTTLEMGQEHSITVYADVRGDLRRACLDWQAACLNPDITMGSFFQSNRRPTRIGEGDDNEPYIKVNLLAPDYQTVIESTIIHGVRVTKVGGLELSNTGGNISTFTVDFKSVYWEQVGVAQKKNDDSSRSPNLGVPIGDSADENPATSDTMQGGGKFAQGQAVGGGGAQEGVGGGSGSNL